MLNRLIEDDAASRGWGGPYAGHPAPYDVDRSLTSTTATRGIRSGLRSATAAGSGSAPRGGDTAGFAAPPPQQPQQPPQGDGWETPATR